MNSRLSPTGSLPAELEVPVGSASKDGSAVALVANTGFDHVRSLSNNAQIGSSVFTGPSFLTSVFSAAQTAANTFSNLTTGVSNSISRGSDSPGPSVEGSPMLTPNLSNPTSKGRLRADTEPAPRKSGEFDDALQHASVAHTIATLGTGQLTLDSIVEDNDSNDSQLLPPTAMQSEANLPTFDSHDLTTTPPNFATASDSAANLLLTERPGSKRNSINRRRGSTASAVGLPSIQQSLPTQSSVPRVTGFAVASKKRNRDFHQLFRSVPEDDYLIEDYGCALSREILLQGRLYISEQHICFNSNIFGWVTNLVISFDEVMAIEKKTTAGLFPNAIVVQTLHARNVFASFISRDSTYELMCSIWHNDELSNGTPSGSSDESSESEREEAESEDAAEASIDEEGDESAKGSPNHSGDAIPSGELDEKTLGLTGPLKHPPTTCGCAPNEHYEKILCDEKFNVPLGRFCTLMWGDDTKWMMNYTTNTLKNFGRMLSAQLCFES